MKVSEALRRVAKKYEVGAAAFFNGMNPDPWLQAHEDLNAVMLTRNPDAIEAAADAFVSKCARFVDLFQANKTGAPKLTAADAFYIGDPTAVGKIQASRDKRCYICESTQGLGLVADPAKPNRVVVACAEHKRATP